jgi:predicted nucleotidyltransferase component of viral defense system
MKAAAPKSPIELVEAFHLLFLRTLEARLDRSTYVVKGGANLRAWFGSPRFSEDLDLDFVGSGEPYLLRDLVDDLLSSRMFQTFLRTQALSVTRVSKPKQTSTTQRWKIELRAPPHQVALHTKVEFSRRPSDEEYVLESVLPEIARAYGIPPPMANHYTAAAAIRQKIGALLGRATPQARDIWDLDHLFRTTGADPRPLPDLLAEILPRATDTVLDLPYEAFKAQVVPFLPPEQGELYGSADAWDRMREEVIERLTELLS